MTDEPKKPTDRQLQRRDLIILAAVLLALFGAYVWDRERASDSNREAFLDGIEALCETDRETKQQQKESAEATVALLALFLALSRENVETGENVDQSQAFIDEFAPQLDEIGKVGNVPRCKKVRAAIERTLQ